MKDPLLIAIAALGCWIAYQQWQTNRMNYNAAIYDRRFRVFDQFLTFLTRLIETKDFSVEQVMHLRAIIVQAECLFDQDIVEYLQGIHVKMGKWEALLAHRDSNWEPTTAEEKEMVKRVK